MFEKKIINYFIKSVDMINFIEDLFALIKIISSILFYLDFTFTLFLKLLW